MRASLSLLLVVVLTASPAFAKRRPHHVKPPRPPHHAPIRHTQPSRSSHGERYRGTGASDNG